MHICICLNLYLLGNTEKGGDNNMEKKIIVKSKKRIKNIAVVEDCPDDVSVSSSLSGSIANGNLFSLCFVCVCVS